jgi:acyl-CoA reductase-like NAD-dependent aldehyde dehydrogenase
MAAARDRRARATGGRRRRLLRRPTVFSDVRSDMTIAQEEIFGPVLAVMPYDTEEEAIEIANGTSYGLSGGVWSGDPKRAQRRELNSCPCSLARAFPIARPRLPRLLLPRALERDYIRAAALDAERPCR